MLIHRCSASSSTADALRRQLLVQPRRVSGRHPLLQLEAVGEALHHASQLREPRIRSRGRYPTDATPLNGRRWWAQRLVKRIERGG
jgi:hypothetical protein